jgi:hypothetical protein
MTGALFALEGAKTKKWKRCYPIFEQARRQASFRRILSKNAFGGSLLVQQTMCRLFRVPFHSTFGETFEYCLSYLERLTEQERTAILVWVSSKVGDPVATEALEALNSISQSGRRLGGRISVLQDQWNPWSLRLPWENGSVLATQSVTLGIHGSFMFALIFRNVQAALE